MSEKIALLVVDCQNDFCDPNGSLFVKGAEGDVVRMANLIFRFGEKINNIYATMDWHPYLSIFHNVLWEDQNGKTPDPFTTISWVDLINKKYMPKNKKDDMEYECALTYTKKVEDKTGCQLVLWPVHCVQGTWGSNIVPGVNTAFQDWQRKTAKNVEYILKGTNPFTENYGAFKTEVAVDGADGMKYNFDLFMKLAASDTILVGGEAGSHCVSKTIEQLTYPKPDAYGVDDPIKKVVWLEDAISPVSGFEEKQEKFIEWAKTKGMRAAKTTDF